MSFMVVLFIGLAEKLKRDGFKLLNPYNILIYLSERQSSALNADLFIPYSQYYIFFFSKFTFNFVFLCVCISIFFHISVLVNYFVLHMTIQKVFYE